jgi:hypothetical protein
MWELEPYEVGEIAFCLRQMRNKMLRQISNSKTKPDDLRKNEERLVRICAILDKLKK